MEIASKWCYDGAPDDGPPSHPRLSGESVPPLQLSRHSGEYNLVITLHLHIIIHILELLWPRVVRQPWILHDIQEMFVVFSVDLVDD